MLHCPIRGGLVAAPVEIQTVNIKLIIKEMFWFILAMALLFAWLVYMAVASNITPQAG